MLIPCTKPYKALVGPAGIACSDALMPDLLWHLGVEPLSKIFRRAGAQQWSKSGHANDLEALTAGPAESWIA